MTIYDIAKQAGVSASTVSRVINNKPGINAQTRKRVQKLLNENHYMKIIIFPMKQPEAW